MLLYTPENKDVTSPFEETIMESKSAREAQTLTKMPTQELFFSFPNRTPIFLASNVPCPEGLII